MSAGIITSHPYFKAMKLTLDKLTTDDLSHTQVCIGRGKLIDKLEPMKDGYVDDVESSGTGLLQQRAQGEAIASGSIALGGTSRYWPVNLGLQLTITEETMDDVKYFKDLINPSQRLLASAYKTQDIDASSLVNNSATAVGGYDQTTLTSSTHALPGGSTQSNRLSTYSTPSVPALMLAKANLALMKDPNGLASGVTAKAIICPEIQADLWNILLKTEGAPGGNLNDINIAKTYGLKVVPIKWLDGSSTTQWGLKTDAENGFRGFNKKKITSVNWVDNGCLAVHHAVYYRMALGWSNWRCWYQGNT
jgi:hypothetical protein